MKLKLTTSGLRRLTRAATVLGAGNVDRVIRSAVTFTAKDYVAEKQGRIDRDIDRPMNFTRRHAYSWDGADKKLGSAISARAFVRQRQARYLNLLEYGGERRYGKKGALSVAPDKRDRFGGLGGGGKNALNNRFLSRKGKRVRYLLATPENPIRGLEDLAILRGGSKKLYGVFQVTRTNRRNGRKDKIRRIVNFDPGRVAKYEEQLNFRKDGLAFGRRELPRKVIKGLSNEFKAQFRKR